MQRCVAAFFEYKKAGPLKGAGLSCLMKLCPSFINLPGRPFL
ncbi:MAG: hypothetical protein RL021_353 [Bacteroidota bacterium]